MSKAANTASASEFVDHDDEGAPLLHRQTRDLEILLLQTKRGIENERHHLAFADDTQRVAGRHPLQTILDPRLLAQTGRIHQSQRPTTPGPFGLDRVARDTGLWSGQHALFAQQTVHQCRFPDIRASDDRKTDGALLRRQCREIDLLVAGRCHRLRQGRAQRVGEGVESLRMLGRDGNGIAETKRMALREPGNARLAFAFVRYQQHPAAQAAQDAREFAIKRGDAGPRIDDEHDKVGLGRGGLGLATHPGLEAPAIGVLEPGGIDHAEA